MPPAENGAKAFGGERLELHEHVDPTGPETSARGHPRLLVTQATPLLYLSAGVVSQHVLGVCMIRRLRSGTERASAKLRAGEEHSQDSQVHLPADRRNLLWK